MSNTDFDYKTELHNCGLLNWNTNLVTAASFCGHDEIASFLLSQGMSQLATYENETPLSISTGKGDLEMMTTIFENYHGREYMHLKDAEWMRLNFKPDFEDIFSFIPAEYKSDVIFAQEQTKGVLKSDEGRPILFYSDEK